MKYNTSYLNISYDLVGHDEQGNQVFHEEVLDKLVVDTGKQEVMKYIGYLPLSAPSGFPFLGFGPCSTITPVVTHTSLGGGSGYEYTGEGVRQQITNWVISAENYVYSGITFTQKMVGSVQIGPGSPFGTIPGSPINMVGLFSTWILPSSPTATSGIMLDEIVLDNQFDLTNLNSLTISVILRQ
jgi:hypothetical protein